MKKAKSASSELCREHKHTEFKKLEGGKSYERRERRLLHLLARGEQEISAGKGFDLHGVRAEADALLAGGPK